MVERNFISQQEEHPIDVIREKKFDRREFLYFLSFLPLFLKDLFQRYSNALELVTTLYIAEQVENNEQLNRDTILAFIIESYGGFIADYLNEKEKYIFHPLDGFPSNNFQQQMTFIQESVEYERWSSNGRSSDSTQNSLGHAYSLEEDSERVLHELTNDQLAVSNILLLKSEVSSLGYEQFSEAFLVISTSSGPELFRLFGEFVREEQLSLEQLKTVYPHTFTEAFIYNPVQLADFQRRVREPQSIAPFFPESETLPPDIQVSNDQYGMFESWGNGQWTGGAPETVDQYVEFVSYRHEMYEKLLGSEATQESLRLHVRMDLTMVAGDTTSFFYDNKRDVVEEVVRKIHSRLSLDGRKVRFSFNIRVPGMWSDVQTASRGADMVYKFIENIYRTGGGFSAGFMQEFTFDWTIDPELPGFAARKNPNIRMISTQDIADIATMITHYSPESHVLFYDLSSGRNNNLIKIVDGVQLPPNVGILYMGTFNLADGVDELTEEMIDQKRLYMQMLLQDYFQAHGGHTNPFSHVGMMTSDRRFNNGYIRQVNDGFIDGPILKRLLAPIELDTGVSVRVNPVQQ